MSSLCPYQGVKSQVVTMQVHVKSLSIPRSQVPSRHHASPCQVFIHTKESSPKSSPCKSMSSLYPYQGVKSQVVTMQVHVKSLSIQRSQVPSRHHASPCQVFIHTKESSPKSSACKSMSSLYPYQGVKSQVVSMQVHVKSLSIPRSQVPSRQHASPCQVFSHTKESSPKSSACKSMSSLYPYQGVKSQVVSMQVHVKSLSIPRSQVPSRQHASPCHVFIHTKESSPKSSACKSMSSLYPYQGVKSQVVSMQVHVKVFYPYQGVKSQVISMQVHVKSLSIPRSQVPSRQHASPCQVFIHTNESSPKSSACKSMSSLYPYQGVKSQVVSMQVQVKLHATSFVQFSVFILMKSSNKPLNNILSDPVKIVP